MNKWLTPGIILFLLVALGLTCWRQGVTDERKKQENALYHHTADSTIGNLRDSLAHKSTLVKLVPVERIKLVQAAGRVDTVTLQVPIADAGHDSLAMIHARDTVIVAMREEKAQLVGHIHTLNDIIAADSGISRLYVIQRITDSTRIRVLEHQVRGFTILGIHLPKLHCVAGPIVVAYPKQVVGLGAACGIGF